MRVLLAGATGYIGQAVLRELVAQGHEVVALVRPGRKQPLALSDEKPNQTPDEFCIKIMDDGIGFDPQVVFASALAQKKLGLIGMKERAELIGSSLEILSNTQNGSTITLIIPHQETKNLNGN